MAAGFMEKQADLCEKILRDTRNYLLSSFRFLGTALCMPGWKPMLEQGMGTDGKNIRYNPFSLMEDYLKSPEKVEKVYLHTVFHLLFLHMFRGETVRADLWNLSTDIAVEAVLTSFDFFEDEKSQEERKELERLKKEVPVITAERIFAYFLEHSLNIKDEERLADLFREDSHSLWYRDFEGKSKNGKEKEEEKPLEESKEEKSSDSDHEAENGPKKAEESLSEKEKKELQKKWEENSKKLSVEMKSFQKLPSDLSEKICMNLDSAGTSKKDYGKFLRQFAVFSEEMKLNEDEFDAIFYTYGLNLYEGMPLIEPLEYKEEKRIRDFVIAIDTSGSVSREMVLNFLTRTYEILMTDGSFSSRMNLHIIQCDAKIQEHHRIHNPEEFREYCRNFKIRGMGGTDFRPVFSLVDSLVKKGEIPNLRGLLYFTDGMGTFPETVPKYKAAFVFLENGRKLPDLPSWAIRLILPKTEFSGKGGKP